MTMQMRREIDEIPEAVERLSAPEVQAQLGDVASRLRRLDPPVILTVARGSSDHAATYLKYAIETMLGRPVASVGPSTVTVFGTRFRAEGLVALAVSQSGASGDLSDLAAALGAAGARVLALTNTRESPLARAAGEVLDVRAGPETAVAATKSFVNSIVAGLWLVAFWSRDRKLEEALRRLPDALARQAEAPELDDAFDALTGASGAMAIGRGAGLGVASEIALKLIETCGLHASAYSGAEVLHGPSAILTDGFPVLALASGAGAGMDQAMRRLSEQGARVFGLPARAETGHRLVDTLLDLPELYRRIEALSWARGRTPDAPRFLSKETRTT